MTRLFATLPLHAARFAAALAMTVVMGSALLLPVSAQESTPTAGVLDGEPANLDCAMPLSNGTPTAPSATFAVVSDQSTASYIAQEELAGRGANTAIGSTNAVVGQILLDSNGLPLACSRIDVDLRTLTSDQSRRDNYLYSNTLETEAYPLATFILTSVEGLEGALVEGEETPVVLIGDLTIRDVTKSVAWAATVTQTGDTIVAKANTSFAMPDFNIEPPIVGSVLSIEERIELELDLTLQKA